MRLPKIGSGFYFWSTLLLLNILWFFVDMFNHRPGFALVDFLFIGFIWVIGPSSYAKGWWKLPRRNSYED